MQIDIITLQAVKNYGSVLQALATQELFKKHGFDVCIINYYKKESRKENLLYFWSGNNILKKIAIYPTLKKWERIFDGFCCENLNLSKEIYTTDLDFEKYDCKADIFCTGSDQVWNSVWNNGVLPPLYLSFVPDDKYKIAFSASFGQELISEEEILKTKEFINKYNKISVREDSGVNILKNQYGYEDAVHIMDPTLGLPADFWKGYEKQIKIKKDYILIYNLNRSKEFDKYAVNLSRKTGLRLVRICTRYDQFYRPGKSILIPSIPEFIYLIDNAKYVLTDSFHATAFSMNMGTEPVCVLPPEFGGRIDSFLKSVNSTQRRTKNYDDYDVINRNVNFSEVNSKLKIEREKIDSFIEEAKKDAQKYYEHK